MIALSEKKSHNNLVGYDLFYGGYILVLFLVSTF